MSGVSARQESASVKKCLPKGRPSPVSRLSTVLVLVLAIAACFGAAAAQAQTFTAPGFVSQVVTTLTPFTPVGMTWAPDGRMFIWTKNGIIRVFKDGALLPAPFIDLSAKVNTFDDRGMWGVTFHPDFSNNGYVYLTYVFEDGRGSPSGSKTSRLTRVTANPANPDTALPGSEVVLLGTLGNAPCSSYPANADCIPADGGSHTIGTVKFTPDGKILVGNGDGSDGDAASLNAQNLNSPAGKIFRINQDGTAPSDNPFYDGTNSWRSKVWIYGVRNPFRFSIRPSTGEAYFGDVGWNTYEEVNRGFPGSNFGWPCYEGVLPQPFFQGFAQCQQLSAGTLTMPLYTYDRSLGSAAIGGTFYTGTVYPEQYQGSYFFADYTGNWIRRVTFDANGNPDLTFPFFATNVGAPVTVEMGPDGLLYYISFTTGQIRRIRYNGPSASASASPTSGLSPLQAFFSSSGSLDPNGGPLSYFWDFGDGTTSTLPDPSHTYTASGVATYTAVLTVTSSTNQTASASVKITVGSTPPTPVISGPPAGTSYQPGQIVAYQGSASDPQEGTLPAAALNWTVLLHHNSHIHTYTAATGVAQGSFAVEDHGIGTYSYEVVLTATDSSGLSGSTSVLLPIVADTTPPTAPSALTATAAGSSEIDLAWQPSTDNGSITSYRVERCQNAGCTNFTEVVAVGGTVYNDLGLPGAATFRYRVRSTDAGGNFSPYSAIVTATTNNPPVSDTQPPTTPSALNAAAVNSTQISLSWGASTDNVGVADYRLERCPGASCSNFVQVIAVTGTAYNDSNLAGGTSYTYRVRAIDAAGNLSAYSNLATAATPAAPPTAPNLVAAYSFNEGSGVTAADASGNFNTGTINGAGWTAQGKFGGALSFDGINDLVVVAGSASLNVTNAMTLEAWINPAASQSGWRTILQREVDAYFLSAGSSAGPLQPAGGATFGGSVAFIAGPSPSPLNTWTHVALTYAASTLRLYVNGLQVSTQSIPGNVQTNSNPLRIGGNSPYGEFFNGLIDEVRIYNRALTAAEILTDMNTPVEAAGPDTTAPTVPGNLSATAIGTSQVNLLWSASADDVGVAGYGLERCQGAGCSNFAQIAAPAATSFGDSALNASTVYSYRVRARDAAGNFGGYSGIASATTFAASDTTPPTAPVNLNASAAGSTEINLTWTASTDNVAVANYLVERCQGSGCTAFAQVGTTAAPAYADSGLSASTTYTYRVRAADTSGNFGSYSTSAAAATSAPPAGAGPVAAYSFNEGAGPAVSDATGNGNTGTINGAAWTTQGRFGGALRFDGVNDLVLVNGSSSLNVSSAMTLEAWINPAAVQSGWRTILQRETDTYFLNASNDSGPLWPAGGGTFGGSVSYVSAPSANPVNTWSHVALTYDGAALRLYVNGALVSTRAAAGGILTNSNNLAIGGNTPYGEYFNGAIDEVRIYGRALSQAEIQADMNAPIGSGAADTTAPSAPSGLGVAAASSTQIDLSWTAATDNVGVTGYRVERCQGAGCSNFAQIAAPGGTSYSDTGLTASTAYSYRVRAIDAAGNLGSFSNTAGATTSAAPDTTAPTAPTGLGAAAASSTQIDLSWTAATDNVGVTGYRVERCQGAGCSNFAQIAAPGGTSYSDTGLTASTVYSYRVRATDAAGNLGNYSGTAGATTSAAADTTAPSAPTGLGAAAASSTQIDLSWTAATDNVGVTGYRVERCQGAGCSNFAQIAAPGGTSYSDTGLTVSTVYSYRVRATDAAGNLGNYSGTAGATTSAAADTSAPTAPTGLGAAAASSTQINLSWTASTDNVGVTGYRVERCQGAGCSNFAQIAAPGGTSYSDTGLTASTVYSYRVRAIDAAGNLGSYSNTAGATTSAAPDTTAPTAPTGLGAAASGSTQINLSWTASTDNVGVTGYRVERCQGAGCSNFAQIAAPGGTSYSDTGLTASTAYSYRVRAVDAAANAGLYSGIASATTAAVVPPAVPVAAWSFNEGSGTTVTDASGNGNSGVITNGATWTTQGKYGAALNFDGTNDLVVVNNSPSLALGSAMTLEAWVYPTASQTGWRTIIQKEIDAYFLDAGSSGTLRPAGGGTFGSTVDYAGSNASIPLNTWTHIAVTYNGSIVRLYVNGTQVATKSRTGAIQSTSTPLRIGGNSPYGEFFRGRIDEIRIYNRALTQTEIQTDMNTPQ